MEQLINVYNGYGTTFHSAGSGNGTARNVIVFAVNNISSSHADNRNDNFWILVLGPTFETNESFDSPEKKFSINFTKTNTKFCSSFHSNTDNVFLFANRKEITKFKADNKTVNFPTQFYLRNISDRFSAIESREVSLKRNMYDFSVDYSSIDKSDILNIHKYLMIKNNMK